MMQGVHGLERLRITAIGCLKHLLLLFVCNAWFHIGLLYVVYTLNIYCACMIQFWAFSSYLREAFCYSK